MSESDAEARRERLRQVRERRSAAEKEVTEGPGRKDRIKEMIKKRRAEGGQEGEAADPERRELIKKLLAKKRGAGGGAAGGAGVRKKKAGARKKKAGGRKKKVGQLLARRREGGGGGDQGGEGERFPRLRKLMESRKNPPAPLSSSSSDAEIEERIAALEAKRNKLEEAREKTSAELEKVASLKSSGKRSGK